MLVAKLRRAIERTDTTNGCAVLDGDTELEMRYALLIKCCGQNRILPDTLQEDSVVIDIVQRLDSLIKNCNFTFLHTSDGTTSDGTGQAQTRAGDLVYTEFSPSFDALRTESARIDDEDNDFNLQLQHADAAAKEAAQAAKSAAELLIKARAEFTDATRRKFAEDWQRNATNAAVEAQASAALVSQTALLFVRTKSEAMTAYLKAKLDFHAKKTWYANITAKLFESSLKFMLTTGTLRIKTKVDFDKYKIEQQKAYDAQHDANIVLQRVQQHLTAKDDQESQIYQPEGDAVASVNSNKNVATDRSVNVKLGGSAKKSPDQLFRLSGLLQPNMNLFGSKVFAKVGRYLAGPEQVSSGSPAARGHYAALYAVPTVAPGLDASTLWVNTIKCNPETNERDLCVWVPANVMEQAFFRTKEFFKCQLRKRKLQLINLARRIATLESGCKQSTPTQLVYADALIESAVRSAMHRINVNTDMCTNSDEDYNADSMLLSLSLNKAKLV